MKCQILFSGKNKKKYFNMSSAVTFTQNAKHLGVIHYCSIWSFSLCKVFFLMVEEIFA